MSDASWHKALVDIDVLVAKLRTNLDPDALQALLDLVPADVMKRPQHPLSLAVRELVGCARSLISGRVLVPPGERPEWFILLQEATEDAFVELERELTTLMREGTDIQ